MILHLVGVLSIDMNICIYTFWKYVGARPGDSREKTHTHRRGNKHRPFSKFGRLAKKIDSCQMELSAVINGLILAVPDLLATNRHRQKQQYWRKKNETREESITNATSPNFQIAKRKRKRRRGREKKDERLLLQVHVSSIPCTITRLNIHSIHLACSLASRNASPLIIIKIVLPPCVGIHHTHFPYISLFPHWQGVAFTRRLVTRIGQNAAAATAAATTTATTIQ